jgi:hypothetical protein
LRAAWYVSWVGGVVKERWDVMAEERGKRVVDLGGL